MDDTPQIPGMSSDDGQDDGCAELSYAQVRALSIAVELARYGIPMFVAPPADTPVGFALPAGWQKTEEGDASVAAVRSWRPGMALCAVGGVAADFIDVDPRNGGHESTALLDASGIWPRSYGQQSTPSGGQHYLVQPLGVGKYQGKGDRLAGLDLQGGRPDGSGRGFVFLAPTERRSKITKEPVPYRWETEPDLALMAEWAGMDETGTGLADMIRGVQRVQDGIPPDGVYLVTADAAGGAAGPMDGLADPFSLPVRVFTRQEAKDYVGKRLAAFKAMRTPEDHGFNAALNDLACAYSHFVPEFVDYNSAMAHMYDAAVFNRSVEYQGEAAVRATIRSGLGQRGDPWKAHLDPREGVTGSVTGDPATPENAQVNDVTGQDQGVVTPAVTPQAARIRRLLYVRSALDSIPPPRPLIAGVLDVATIAVLSGKFGTYKSFVALSWACSLATGKPWFGRDVPAAVPVLYVAAEGLSGVSRRIRAWEAASNGGQRVADTHLAVIGGAVNLSVPEDVRALDEVIGEIRPGFVVLDTLHRCAAGVDENSAKEMGQVTEMVALLRERSGATVLACHHTGHGGMRARGSSSIEDDYDASWVIRLDNDDEEDRSARNARTMHHRKTKDGEISEPIPLELVVSGESAYVRQMVTGDGFSAIDTVWLGAREIAIKLDDIGASPTIGYRLANAKLRDEGLVFSSDRLKEALRLRKSGKSYVDAPGLAVSGGSDGSGE